MLAPKAGGPPRDLLKMALEYRSALGWHTTQLKELYAFVSFAYAYPDSFTALVDSYNTLESGVKNFLLVALALHDLGYSAKGIRLDSGDLASLSQESKRMFKETGARFGRDFSHMNVIASNDINEDSIRELIAKKHEIDVFGIGTNLVTCQAQPALGMVYKVCDFKGKPRIKISEEPAKTTIPGSKKIFRAHDHQGRPTFDVLSLSCESLEEKAPVYNRITGEKHIAQNLV